MNKKFSPDNYEYFQGYDERRIIIHISKNHVAMPFLYDHLSGVISSTKSHVFD